MLEFIGENPFFLLLGCCSSYVIVGTLAFVLGRRGLPIKWVGWRGDHEI